MGLRFLVSVFSSFSLVKQPAFFLVSSIFRWAFFYEIGGEIEVYMDKLGEKREEFFRRVGFENSWFISWIEGSIRVFSFLFYCLCFFF